MLQKPSNAEAEKILAKFRELLDRTNREHPRPQDVKALAEFLNDNKKFELWRLVWSAGQFAEHLVIENAPGVPGLKECWKQRLEGLRKDLGYADAPMLETLLIQHAALCWLNLSLTEVRYSMAMSQSITLTLGVYWEKRLSGAQKRFTRACESLAKVRKLSRNAPALQVNIAGKGGQQVNLAK
jgi:hypothetical protein